MAARLVVAAAAVVRTPPVIRTLAIVGHTLTPRARGVRITARRLLDLRVQATLVARNGARWTQRRWPRLKPYVRACLAGVAGLATTRILHDGKVTLDEWKHYLLIADPGNPNPDVLNLYFNPALDFSVPRDGWTAACAVGVVTRGATG